VAVNPVSLVGRFFGRFFGATIGEAAGYGIGGAMQEPIKPLLQQLANETWATATAAGVGRPLSVGEAAEIVAEDVELREWGVAQAGQEGRTEQQFDAVLGAALNAPGIPQLFEAWRRELIDDAAFEHGLRKAKLEPRWDAPLKALKQRLLSLDQLANARQQGFIDAARQRAEAALQGQDAERADISFELSGLPPGIESMQEALNRGLVDRATFDQAIREGHTKTKYTDLVFALRQPVLSAQTYATLHLKGWIDAAAMNAGGALHGYTAEQMNDLYLSMGRPASPGYMWTAAARGIDGPDGRPVDEAQFTKAIAESDIRPEYAPMLWRIRYLYPSLFQLSRLVTSGTISGDVGAEWASKARYAPEVVTALRASWAGGSSAAPDPHVARAQTHLWNQTHKSYVAEEADEPTTRAQLTSLTIPVAAQDAIIALWNDERALVRKQLTAAQIKRAYGKAKLTRDVAVTRLVAMGYSLADASLYLDE
jgi:hypothetical protein